MKQEEFELLMQMPPSEFYLWLWKKQAKHEIGTGEAKAISKKYEQENAELLEAIKKEEI